MIRNGVLASQLLLTGGLMVDSDATLARRPVDRFTNVSGVWIDSARAAQGMMIEQLDEPFIPITAAPQRVGVSWFTWAPASDPNPGPRWLFGIGLRDGDTIVVDPVQIAIRGRAPGMGSAPVAVVEAWGRLEIAFDDWIQDGTNIAAISFQGPPGWGAGTREYKQITRASSGYDYNFVLDPPIPYFSKYAAAGTYSDPMTRGQGWVLNIYGRPEPSAPDGSGSRAEAALIWFSYDLAGAPTWSFGIDPDLWSGMPTFAMQQARSGGTFEGGTPILEPAGILRARGSGGPPEGINCGTVSYIDWTPATGGGAYGVNGARLTQTFDPHVVPPDLCFSR